MGLMGIHYDGPKFVTALFPTVSKSGQPAEKGCTLSTFSPFRTIFDLLCTCTNHAYFDTEFHRGTTDTDLEISQ